MGEESQNLEPILVVPPQLTKSSYATLLALDYVPRQWHPEGRYGSRTHKLKVNVDAGDECSKRIGKIGIPLLKDNEKINAITSILRLSGGEDATAALENDSADRERNVKQEELVKLLRTPGVELIFETPVPSNKIPKDETIDATIHPNRMPKGFLLKLNDFLTADYEEFMTNGVVEQTFAPGAGSHPPRKRNKFSNDEDDNSSLYKFTFCELFAGIGGFGVALEALGGKCVFASEIYEPSKRVYEANLNLDLESNRANHKNSSIHDEKDIQSKRKGKMSISGDIWDVKSKDIPSHDILVGGFPCQPFSSLGDQPGLQDSKQVSGRKQGTLIKVGQDNDHNETAGSGGGRGQLFTQIVRVLRDIQPSAFLLENVPGLITTDGGRALKTILSSLKAAGYSVSYEVCSSRGLTAQSRKRLYFAGIHNKYHSSTSNQALDGNMFQFPFMPDLQLRAGDILHTAEELQSSFSAAGIPDNLMQHCDFEATNQSPASLLRLTDAQMDQLRHRSKSWKPAKLAWDNTSCDTIDSHYGVSVGKGNSQLVPSSAPHHPRRLSPRECARIMGFSNSFKLGEYTKRERHVIEKEYDDIAIFNGFIKEQYYMLGNAVCPPVIAVLVGAILSHIPSSSSSVIQNKIKGDGDGDGDGDGNDWIDKGLWAGIKLAYDALTPSSREKARTRLSKKLILNPH